MSKKTDRESLHTEQYWLNKLNDAWAKQGGFDSEQDSLPILRELRKECLTWAAGIAEDCDAPPIGDDFTATDVKNEIARQIMEGIES